MERKAKKGRKSGTTGPRKTEAIPVRVTKEEKDILVAKARRRGLGVSSWLVMLGLTAPENPETGTGTNSPSR
jgi:hypothetical protein